MALAVTRLSEVGGIGPVPEPRLLFATAPPQQGLLAQ